MCVTSPPRFLIKSKMLYIFVILSQVVRKLLGIVVLWPRPFWGPTPVRASQVAVA